MRVVTILTAMAALWAIPAHAVQVVTLTGPNSTAINHQKITLTGLTAADAVSISAYTGSFVMNWWTKFPNNWYLDGNGYIFGSCDIVNGSCHDGFSLASPAYSTLDLRMSAEVDIEVLGNDIFVDWSKYASGLLCGQIAESDRVDGNANKCGYAWKSPDLAVFIDVTGPSAQTFSYSVSNYNPVPEPESWALMIMGTGMAGAAMRRRQRRAVSYNFG